MVLAMPRLVDPDSIRRLLRADPVWGVYALGDLSPAMFPKTQWFAPDLRLGLLSAGPGGGAGHGGAGGQRASPQSSRCGTD